jgi:predicted metal-dependent phosphoesterase TrpH
MGCQTRRFDGCTGDATGLLVIVGEEVYTTEGEVIGYFLSEMVPSGLTPEETVDRIVGQGGVVCVPHPFDRFRRSPLSRAALERIAGAVHLVTAVRKRLPRSAKARIAERGK